MQATVRVDGQQIAISATEAVIYTDGDLDGNIDVSIRVSPPVASDVLLSRLRIRVTGEETSLDAIAYEDAVGGVDAIFFAPALCGASSIPPTIILEWDSPEGTMLGSVPCRRA